MAQQRWGRGAGWQHPRGVAAVGQANALGAWGTATGPGAAGPKKMHYFSSKIRGEDNQEEQAAISPVPGLGAKSPCHYLPQQTVPRMLTGVLSWALPEPGSAAWERL